MMAGMVLVGTVLLLGIGAAAAAVLLTPGEQEEVQTLCAVAFLPVPEDTPSARAFLSYYASQVSWMDAQVLRCVILVGSAQTMPLCRELARDYPCYAAMTLAEAQDFLAGQVDGNEE